MRPGRTLLRCDKVCVRFGGIAALDDVTFEVPEGTIVGLIGPNGAGKTTLFNCISRLYTVDSGAILFDGTSLLTRPRHQMAALGIARTFQNVALFDSMTAAHNVMLGAHAPGRPRFLADAFAGAAAARRDRELAAEAERLLEFVGLRGIAQRRVLDLPFGVRKRVELARALAAKPRFVMLDEPIAGLNHAEIDDLTALVRSLRDSMGVTVLLVEHHMGVVMHVSDTVVVLDFGRVIADGPPGKIRNDPEVIRAYLGGTS